MSEQLYKWIEVVASNGEKLWQYHTKVGVLLMFMYPNKTYAVAYTANMSSKPKMLKQGFTEPEVASRFATDWLKDVLKRRKENKK